MTCKIGIIGGGLSSLACGMRLSQKCEVTIFEKEDRVGGLAATFYKDGKDIPMAYHHVQTPEYMTIEYSRPAGINLNFVKTTQALYYNGVHSQLTSPLDILKYPHLSLKGRIGLSLFGVRCMTPPLPKQGVTAYEWLNKWAGTEVRQHMFEPMAKIKFGASTKHISALWLARRMREKIRAKEGHSPIDVKQLLDYFTQVIIINNGTIKTNTPVHHISRNTIDGEHFDYVISSIPPKEFLKLIDDVPQGKASNPLTKVRYQPCVCSVVSLDQPITKHYWNIILKPELPFGGFFDYSIITPNKNKDEGHLYYFVRYPNHNHQMIADPNFNFSEAVKKTIDYLGSPAHINWIKTFKFINSTPIYDAEYPEKFPKTIAGVYLTGHYLLFPLERTMHTAILSGERTANTVRNDARL